MPDYVARATILCGGKAMNGKTTEEWKILLSRLNESVFASERWKARLYPEALAAHWCGWPPATPEEILTAERRLGVPLPPSYRAFLSVSNGWERFGSFVQLLLQVQEIDWYRNADPEGLAGILDNYQEDDVSDEEYLDYDTDEHAVAICPRYYPDCLLVGKSLESKSNIILLNSKVVSAEGEWEAIFFADWLPGNQRYRSFYDLAQQHPEFL
jgi:hypothetical protein